MSPPKARNRVKARWEAFLPVGAAARRIRTGTRIANGNFVRTAKSVENIPPLSIQDRAIMTETAPIARRTMPTLAAVCRIGKSRSAIGYKKNNAKPAPTTSEKVVKISSLSRNTVIWPVAPRIAPRPTTISAMSCDVRTQSIVSAPPTLFSSAFGRAIDRSFFPVRPRSHRNGERSKLYIPRKRTNFSSSLCPPYSPARP